MGPVLALFSPWFRPVSFGAGGTGKQLGYPQNLAPCLSTLLSGTPKQIASLIPSAENGLFSRFSYYVMKLKPVWKDVFEYDSKTGLDEYYYDLGKEFFGLYASLSSEAPVRVVMAEEQKERFSAYFKKAQNKYINLKPEEYIATVRRLGLICFRMCMLFSGLRIMEEGEFSGERVVEDRDFDNAIAMMDVLLRHSSALFNLLPEESQLVKKVNKKERFLEALPGEFSRKEYLVIAEKVEISEKMADHYIRRFVDHGVIFRNDYNSYFNPEKGEGGEDVPA